MESVSEIVKEEVTSKFLLKQLSDFLLDEKEILVIKQFPEVLIEKYNSGGIDQVKAYLLEGRHKRTSVEVKKHLEDVANCNTTIDKKMLAKAEDAIAANLMLKLQELITSVDSSKIHNASLRDITSAMGTLFDKYRLSQEKSTENVNTQSISILVSKISESYIPGDAPEIVVEPETTTK